MYLVLLLQNYYHNILVYLSLLLPVVNLNPLKWLQTCTIFKTGIHTVAIYVAIFYEVTSLPYSIYVSLAASLHLTNSILRNVATISKSQPFGVGPVCLAVK